MKIFITRVIPSAAEKLLKKEGFEVEVYKKDKPIEKNELIRRGANADGIISLLTDKIDNEIIDELKACKVIANYAVGYNNIDIKHAAKKEIKVTNTPDILTDATADLAMALVLACARRVVESDEYMRKKKFTGWKPELKLGIELRGKKLGIIGAGRIGTETALRAKAFSSEILYYNRSENKELERKTGAEKVSLKKLLKESDIISLHLPLTDKTHHLLNKANLKLMKPDAVFVNTARGEIVDEKVLIKMLKANEIFAAGFDVYEGEPNVNEELYKLKNVVLLPHIGSATRETRSAMAELAAENCIRVLRGKKAVTPVN